MSELLLDLAGSARTKCGICGGAIARLVPRLIEETTFYGSDDNERVRRTYWHLACAVEVKPELARTGLIGRKIDASVLATSLALVERLDAELAAEVRGFREREYKLVEKRTVPLDGPETAELLAQLEAEPADRALLAVLGDHLQQRGDDRGELIVLALENAADPTLFARRRELEQALSPRLPDNARVVWGIGFVRKLEMWVGTSLAEHAAILAHPACRLLESLQLQRQTSHETIAVPDGLPRTLRSLHVNGVLTPPEAITALPYLERLELELQRWPPALAHPTLRSLVLHFGSEDLLARFASSLPGVTELEVRHRPENVIEVLDRTGWLARVEQLSLINIRIEADDISRLETKLRGKKLARLELGRHKLDIRWKPRLEKLCDELRCDFAMPRAGEGEPVWIEHTAKPEWGRGKLVREADGKVVVEFASGTKTFKADAPFLKRS